MKKIICSFIFCSLAILGTAQHLKIVNRGNDNNMVDVTVPGDIQYEPKIIPPPTGIYAWEKLHKKLFAQVVTPEMKEIYKGEMAKISKPGNPLDYYKGWLSISPIFDKATGKIVDVSFGISKDFLKVFGEKNLKKLYRSIMTQSIDTKEFRFDLEQNPPYALVGIADFLRYSIEEK